MFIEQVFLDFFIHSKLSPYYFRSEGDDNIVVAGGLNQVIINEGASAIFRAGDYIVLNRGFRARVNSRFQAILALCNQSEGSTCGN